MTITSLQDLRRYRTRRLCLAGKTNIALLCFVSLSLFHAPYVSAYELTNISDARQHLSPDETPRRFHDIVTGFSGCLPPTSARISASASRVSLTGIGVVEQDEKQEPTSSRILLRSPEDMKPLDSPYWGSSLILLLIIPLLVLLGSLVIWRFERRVEPAPDELRERDSSRVRQRLSRLSRWLAAFTGTLCSLVLTGWLLDIPVLQGIMSSRLMPNAAFAILTAALAVFLIDNERRSTLTLRLVFSCATAVVGALTLFEYAASWNLQIDGLLIPNLESVSIGSVPDRMAISTALCLLLIGSAIFLTNFRRCIGLGQVLALAAGTLSLFNVIINLYGSEAHYGAGAHATMAVSLAAALVILSMAALLSQPGRGLIRTISLSGSGGVMARRLLPIVIGGPVFLGWIRLQGQIAGSYDTRFGLALFALWTVVCFGFVIWSSAAVLNRLYGARSWAEMAFQQRDRRLEMVFQTASIGDWTWDAVKDELTAHSVVWKLYDSPDHQGSEPARWFQRRQHPNNVEMIAASISEAVAQTKLLDIGFLVIQPDGNARWICCRGTPTCDDSGKLLKVDGINFDITDRKLAEKRVRESEEPFRQLADAMPQIVWTMDAQGEIAYYNRRWYEYTGASFETPWAESVHSDDLDRCRAVLEESTAAGVPYELELRIKRGVDSVFRWHLARAIPVRNGNGRIERWFGTSTDIDKSKRASAELKSWNQHLENRVQERSEQLAESERRYRMLVESFKDYAIFMLDSVGNITTWNAGAKRMSGYRTEEILGQHFAIFHQANDVTSGHPERELEAAKANGQYQSEGWRLRNDGSSFWASVLVTVIDDHQKLRGFSVIVRDMTAQKEAERLVVAEQKRAEEASRAKSSFLAAMSHEIRTPMNAILGMADLLWETDLNPVQREYTNRFRRAGTSLLSLINDILDLSKIEAGHFELESIEFDLSDVIAQTVELMAARARMKNIELHSRIMPGTPDRVKGDPGRLQQILNNLIGNAVKFTGEGSVLLTVANHADGSPGHLTFAVRDTGIGIPANKIGAIFEDFTQAESSTTRRFGGTGLGLGICRRLVDRMSGELKVDSVGEGSIFYFDIVLALGERAIEAEKKELIDLKDQRVLIIDDSETGRIILGQMCAGWEMVVVEAVSAMQAKELLREAVRSSHPFSLVLLDWVMPEVGGLEALEQLREIDSSVPIVVASSDNRPGDVTKAKALGAAAYVTKPVRRSQLLSVLSTALAARKAIDLSEAARSLEKKAGAGPSDAVMNILIADDSDDNRFLLTAYLKHRPYELTFATNGQEAVELFRNRQFDLVLMDMHMPVLDGLAATLCIRALENEISAKQTPIVALTANALIEDIERSRIAGCDLHLSKPISKEKLIAAIESFKPEPTTSLLRLQDALDKKISRPIEIPEGFEELSRNYLTTRQAELEKLLECESLKDYAALRTFGHDLKGTGTPYGFPELTRLGGHVEEAAKETDTAALSALLLQVSQYLQYAEQALLT